MLKFVVVLYKKPGMSAEDFRQHLRQEHSPLAQKLPGLRKYVQNYVVADPKRKPPGWNGIVELYFDDWSAMETAWASPEGAASDADLPAFADLSRTTWSVVEEATILISSND
jgi:uncharacterized protein (TIGR02118 family)